MELIAHLPAILLIALTLSSISAAQNTPEDYLTAHNAIRADVGVGPLSWDDSLAAYAQSYADTRIETCDMVHSHGPYGENLAMGYGAMTAATAVELWSDERKLYDYESNSCSEGGECRHYTQVVWRNSERVGCANVQCRNNWVFLICSYDPPGNYIGQRPY